MPEFVPVIEVEIIPHAGHDQSRLIATLAALAAEDAEIRFTFDNATGCVVMAGIDERQLDRTIDALRRQHAGQFTIGPPQIAYRETISRPATVDYTHKRLKSGEGEFARVTLMVEPIDPAVGNRCVIGSNDGVRELLEVTRAVPCTNLRFRRRASLPLSPPPRASPSRERPACRPRAADIGSPSHSSYKCRTPSGRPATRDLPAASRRAVRVDDGRS